MKPQSRTWIAFFTVIAAWGSSYLFIHLAVVSFTPVGLVMTRFGLASVLCALIAVARNEEFPRDNVALRFAAVGMMMMTGSNALTAFAQSSVSSGIAALLLAGILALHPGVLHSPTCLTGCRQGSPPT